MRTIDLNNPPPNHRYKVDVAPEETPGERSVRLTKDLMVFLLAVGFVIVLAYFCVSTVLNAAAGQDEKKWAMSVLSAISGGLIGYIVRK